MSKQPTINTPPPLPGLLYRGMTGPDEHVKLAQDLLLREGYFSGSPMGNFGPLTESAVTTFQMQHLGRSGAWLAVDGKIGPDTWWALHNPTGKPQSSGLSALIPEGIDGLRADFLEAALKEHANGTREIPLGSNWGDGVTRFLKGIGAAPWCMFMISTLIKDTTGRYPFGHRHGHCWTFWQEAMRAGLAAPKADRRPVPGDIGVMRYAPSYAGHVFIVLRVSQDGRSMNTIGGNEADRVKLGVRRDSLSTLLGWVNLWGDLPRKFERGITTAAAAEASLAGTR